MPIHDWTRVDSGIFHHFHQAWIVEIAAALNDELLPDDYFALEEQHSGQRIPDVLTLKKRTPQSNGDSYAVRTATQKRPKTRFVVESDAQVYARKASQVVVRHVSDNRVVAVVEVLSLGNKASEFEFNRFLQKVFELLGAGVHLQLIDLHPRTKRDPRGIHAAIWEAITGQKLSVPKNLPLSVVSYEADDSTRGYFEPLGVGRTLPDMPLFIEPGWHVPLPLERTYQAAFRRVPKHLREELA